MMPRSRLIALTSALLYFVLIVGGGALIAFDSLQSGRWLRAMIVIGLALLASVIWLRMVAINRRGVRHDAEPPPAVPPEETGVWGVGGPAMREPGSTGILHTLRPPRADRDED